MSHRRILAEFKLGRKMTPAERQCFLKWPLTEEQAAAEQARMRKKGIIVKAFRCDQCGEFHVGKEKI